MKYLVVGCGLSGAVIARELANEGVHVEIWDRRDHIGGNMYDYVDEHGILVQKYGPHTFHTNDASLFSYICQYENWVPYELRCGAFWDDTFTPTPFNFQTIDQFVKDDPDGLKELLIKEYPKQTATVLELLNNPNKKIREYAEYLFKMDYSLYTAKQWGVPPETIDPSVLKRVPLLFSYEEHYFSDKYQVMPKNSYTDFFKKLLDHPNITIRCNVEALPHFKIVNNHILVDGFDDYCVIYTGALDHLFANQYGALPYRSLIFEWKHENKKNIQPYPVVAYPSEKYTRITEYNQLPPQDSNGTTYAIEYSITMDENSEPYYPVITEESSKLYEKYKSLADKVDNLYYCGRLADFKYYNMDQTLNSALLLFSRIKKQSL